MYHGIEPRKEPIINLQERTPSFLDNAHGVFKKEKQAFHIEIIETK